MPPNEEIRVIQDADIHLWPLKGGYGWKVKDRETARVLAQGHEAIYSDAELAASFVVLACFGGSKDG